MITNFKIFERKGLYNCTLLILELSKLMKSMGYNTQGNIFNMEIKDKRNFEYIFAIVHRQIINEDIVAFKNSADKTTNTDISKYLINYLKTINGLEYIDGYYDGSFIINGDINKILNDINEENFKVFINAKKYNL